MGEFVPAKRDLALTMGEEREREGERDRDREREEGGRELDSELNSHITKCYFT